jgi:hypothetical protein
MQLRLRPSPRGRRRRSQVESRLRARPGPVVVPATLALCFAAASPAFAAASFSATAESEYRFRGAPLTNGEPDVRLAVAYDHRSGAYGGASVLVGRGARGTVQAMGYAGYVGYARRAGPGLSLDLGATHARYIGRLPGEVLVPGRQGTPVAVRYTLHYDSEYSEAYVGLIGRDLSAHLYVSPDYLGQGQTTAYLDLSGVLRPARRLRLSGHAGALAPLGGHAKAYAPAGLLGAGLNEDRGLRYDMRLAAAVELGRAEVQLAWTHADPRLE